MANTTVAQRKRAARIAERDDENVVAINVPVPSELHRRVRVKAVQQGLTLKDAVIAALELYAKTK